MFNRALTTLLVVAGVFALLATGAPGAAARTRPAPKTGDSLALRARYDASAILSWAHGTLAVDSTAFVTNNTAQPVQQLTFNLGTLRTGAAHLTKTLVRGTPVVPTVSDQTVSVLLPTALAPGSTTSVTIAYEATFNSTTGEMRSIFIQQDGIVTSYRWIPWLSREQPFSTPNFGETWVTAVSPRVRVWLKSDTPVKFATTGHLVGTSGGAQMFVARYVRDFNFSASAQYRVKNVAWRGKTVRFYTRTLPMDTLVTYTIATLDRLSDLLGDYPYSELAVAEMPEATGMESPGMNWISARMTGSRLKYMLVHEVAHQWFYSLAGNNQGTEPFADEAVADFLTRDQLGTFRQSQCATAPLDESVYSYSARCYNEVIYVQGGQYLKWYRSQVGATAFWAGLRSYCAQYADKLPGTRKLLDALDAASGFDSSRHAARFPSLYP